MEKPAKKAKLDLHDVIQIQCIDSERPFLVPKCLILRRSKLFAREYADCTENVYADLGGWDIGPDGEGPDDERFNRYLQLLYTGDIISQGEDEFRVWRSILEIYDVAALLEDSKSANTILDKIAETLHQEGLRSHLLGAIYYCIRECCYDLALPRQLIIDFITTCMTSQELESLFEEPLYCDDRMCQEVALAFARQREKEGRTPQKKLGQLDKYYMKD